MVIGLGSLVGGLGGEIPITVWTAESKKQQAQWLPAVFFLGFLGSVAACILWALTYWWWQPAFLKGLTGPLAAIVLATIPLIILWAYLMAVLTGLERFRARSGIGLSNQLAALVALTVLVLSFGRTPEMAILGYLAGTLIAVLVTAALLRNFLAHSWKGWSVSNWLGKALSLGLRSQFGNLATFFNYRLDIFIVNYFLHPAQVGIYSVGVVVAEGLWQIPNAAALALLPRTARTIDEGAAEFTCLVIRQILIVAVLCGLGIALLSPLAIPLLFGAQFTPAIVVIWWLLPGVVALSLGKVISADLAGRGKPELSSIFAIVSLVVTVVLDLFLIPRMGIQGAALASSVAYSVDSSLLAFALKRHLKVSWKTLFVPTYAELASFQLVWRRCKAWLWPAYSPTGAGPLG
jgi:O-antigen/teichoic acid export membrane protein